VPDADLTGPRDLPVLVVAGAGAAARLCADLADGAIAVRQPLTAMPEPDLDDHTVGLLNRGIPGFAVDTGGALHLSLLRSCTGWPSGVWIDPPRRTAPDGSNFQQQHWTHSFAYSVVGAAGDWRAAGLVRHGHEVNHPLHAALGAGGPAAASFVTVEPMQQHSGDGAADVVVAALKPTGNPHATGTAPGASVEHVTVRLYEAAGRAADVRLRLWTPAASAARTNLLEEPGAALPVVDGAVAVHLTGAQIAQAIVGTGPLPAAPVAPRAAYARYWLHNTGPAPIGNLPVTVHVDPPVSLVSGPVPLTVTVASELTRDRAVGDVELVLPLGWTAEPASFAYDLDPGGHLSRPVVVQPPPDAGDGVFWVRARLDSGVEDVARLLAGVDGPETVAAVPGGALRLRPGEEATVELDLSTDAAGPIAVEVTLVSPWHT
jgi:hypothetical protein